jgi:hypothetical protein
MLSATSPTHLKRMKCKQNSAGAHIIPNETHGSLGKSVALMPVLLVYEYLV